MSWRSSFDGSSSTMIAMFRISLRNRFGIDCSASATSFSKWLLSNGFQFSVWSFQFDYRRAFTRDDQAEVVAVVHHEALFAQRPGSADAAAVEDQGIRRPGP